jgi:hypothetical protein
MSHTRPSNRSLRDLEKEARGLLHGLHKRELGAVRQTCLFDSEASGFQGRLADAQYIIARKYGYKSWQDLKQRLKERRFTKSATIPANS